MKRLCGFLAFVLLCTLATLPFFGCTKSNGLIVALDIEDKGRYDNLLAEFTAQTGIAVSAVYGVDISKLIGTKDEPDIIKTSTVSVGVMKNSLTDLTSYAQAEGFSFDVFNDTIMSSLKLDGKVYAFPTSINTSMLYYNKTLFDASAAELRAAFSLEEDESVYPKDDWTHEDFKRAGVILTKYTGSGDNKTYTQFGAQTERSWWGEWLVYVNQYGGSFYEEGSNNRVSALTSPEAVAATTFYRNKSMGDETQKFAPNAIEAEAGFSFAGGKAAMIFGGHLGDTFSYDALGLDWDMQVLPVPEFNRSAKGGEISADAYGISLRSKKKQDAFKFLQFWTGERGALEMFENGKIAALKNMQQLIAELPEDKRKSVNIDAVFTAMERAVPLPNEMFFDYVCRQYVMGEINRLIITGRGSLSDPAAALANAKNAVDNYYINYYG